MPPKPNHYHSFTFCSSTSALKKIHNFSLPLLSSLFSLIKLCFSAFLHVLFTIKKGKFSYFLILAPFQREALFPTLEPTKLTQQLALQKWICFLPDVMRRWVTLSHPAFPPFFISYINVFPALFLTTEFLRPSSKTQLAQLFSPTCWLPDGSEGSSPLSSPIQV